MEVQEIKKGQIWKVIDTGVEFIVESIKGNNVYFIEGASTSKEMLYNYYTYIEQQQTPLYYNNEKGYKESQDKLEYELDWIFIKQVAERMSSNKDKYPAYNWKKSMDIDKLKQSLFRHVLEVMNGNYKDEDREQGHLEAIVCNAMFINYQLNI